MIGSDRVRPQPGARYVHPKASSTPASEGEHDAHLDVASEHSYNYLRWISDLLVPHLGRSVLELGAGIGTITELYASGREVVATDLSDYCNAALRTRFGDAPNVTVLQQDARELVAEGRRFDSVVMVNVLEHIEDDAGLLASLVPLVGPAGRIVIYVPALNGLYGPWDRAIGHFRRYSKWRMREVAKTAGLEVVELRYVNLIAIPAWFVHARSDLDQSPAGRLSLWDRFAIPVIRALETRVQVPIGLNLLAVLRPPAQGYR